MNREKKRSFLVLKSPGLGDIQILISNIHHISKTINRPLTIVAQKTTGAKETQQNQSSKSNDQSKENVVDADFEEVKENKNDKDKEKRA